MEQRELSTIAWTSRLLTLRADLAKAATKAGFNVVKVDCRRESCVAVAEWQSFASAEQGWGSILNQSYHVPCGITVALQETPNPAARYQHSVLFRCDPEYRHRAL